MYLVIQNKADQFGLTPPPIHRHVRDYKKGLAEFVRLTKSGVTCTTFLDHEYETLYGIKAEKDQGESA